MRVEGTWHRLASLVAVGSLVLAGATAFGGVHPAGAAGTASVTTISSNRTDVRYAQPIAFTAHVTGVGATPTGTVSFAAGATSLGSVPLSAGTATLNIASLTTDLGVGVTASYGGDATFAGSASSPLTIATGKNQAFLFLEPVNTDAPDECDDLGNCHWLMPASTLVVFEAVLFLDNPLSEPDPTVGPSGSITFHNLSGTAPPDFGTAPLHNGIATITVPQQDVGAFLSVYADYAGDANYLPSGSRIQTVAELAPPSGPQWRFETNDGAGGNASGHLPADIGAGASTVTYAGVPHVFSYDQDNGNLRHDWWDGRRWNAETLDGAGVNASGTVDADVGRHTSALIYGGLPHVFYYDATHGDLRHAWWDGRHWRYEITDGSAGAVASGRVTRDVGETPATGTYGIQLHVYDYDVTNGDLRHAWWDGHSWHAETLDGNTDDAVGRRSVDAGRDVALTLYTGTPHTWYYDATNGNLRHGWWTGQQWRFETLDGDVANAGRVTGDLGRHPTVVLYGGQPHVWYQDASQGALRHAWWSGTRWSYEHLDGFGGFSGEVVADVGADATAMIYGGAPHVWYRDATFGYLRHAWWNGSEWNFEALDGFTGDNGRVPGDLGNEPSVLNFDGQPHVWYHDATHHGLRHAWYG